MSQCTEAGARAITGQECRRQERVQPGQVRVMPWCGPGSVHQTGRNRAGSQARHQTSTRLNQTEGTVNRSQAGKAYDTISNM